MARDPQASDRNDGELADVLEQCARDTAESERRRQHVPSKRKTALTGAAILSLVVGAMKLMHNMDDDGGDYQSRRNAMIEQEKMLAETRDFVEQTEKRQAEAQVSTDVARSMGILPARHAGPPAPPTPAVRALMKKCDAGDRDACLEAGLWFFEGERGNPNYEKARELLHEACTKSVAAACSNLGILLQEGAGGEVDLKRARATHDKACKIDPYYGCTSLALMFKDGVAGAKDPRHALVLLDQSCKAQNPKACHNLAALHEEGVGTKKDPPLAASKYARNCQGKNGYAPSCVRAAKMAADATPGDELPAAAKRYYAKACQLGDDDACKLGRDGSDGSDDSDDDFSDDDFSDEDGALADEF